MIYWGFGARNWINVSLLQLIYMDKEAALFGMAFENNSAIIVHFFALFSNVW